MIINNIWWFNQSIKQTKVGKRVELCKFFLDFLEKEHIFVVTLRQNMRLSKVIFVKELRGYGEKPAETLARNAAV